MTPLQRLQGGYYNSDPVSEANPGGFGDGGHVVNFPAALADLGLIAGGVVLDAEAIGQAGAKADAAAGSAAEAAASAEEAALIASGHTVRSGEGLPASGFGRDGDWYIDRLQFKIYGPKTAGAWGAGTPIIGPDVGLRSTETFLQWRLGDGAWVNLIPLAELRGADAEDLGLQVSATHIQWRLGTGPWVNLIALAALLGAPGTRGSDGEALSLQKTATHIQWRLGAGAWANLVALTDLMPAVPVKTSAAALRAMTNATDFITPKDVADAAALVPLTDAATVAVDLAVGTNFSLTLGGNRTLGAPTNAKPGTSGTILIKQDATGSRTLAYASAWLPFGATPALTTTANAVDLMTWIAETSGKVRFSLNKGGLA